MDHMLEKLFSGKNKALIAEELESMCSQGKLGQGIWRSKCLIILDFVLKGIEYIRVYHIGSQHCLVQSIIYSSF